ncbi:MAG TPA: hypothetical protein VGR45_14325 [Stellaceae bacterium]|nr:hypothetical protein [Stellaceae bacterium]
MPKLTDAWFADRSPGAGKVLFGSGLPSTGQPIGGIIGNPGVGNPPGPALVPGGPTPLPAPGAPVTPGIPLLTQGLTGVGFTGATSLAGAGLPTAADKSAVSLSCWLDYNALLDVLVFTPDSTKGFIFTTTTPGSDPAGYSSSDVGIAPGSYYSNGNDPGNISPLPPSVLALNTSFPSHWAHFMLSIEEIAGTTNDTQAPGNWVTAARVVCYINDTLCVDNTVWSVSVASDLIDIFGCASCVIGANHAGANLTAGLTEFWVDWGHFIDWNVQANRYAFHNADAGRTRFVPCSLGKTGSLPFGRPPLIYMTGNHSDFVYNRARGNQVATVTGTLVDVTDGFG